MWKNTNSNSFISKKPERGCSKMQTVIYDGFSFQEIGVNEFLEGLKEYGCHGGKNYGPQACRCERAARSGGP